MTTRTRQIYCLLSLFIFCLPHIGFGENTYLWNTHIWSADNGQNTTWMWGADVSGPLFSDWNGSAAYSQGRFNQGGDIEENEEVLLLAGPSGPNWQCGFGFSYLGFSTELQRGFVWSYPEEEQERNDDVYGPVLFARYERYIFSENTGLYALAIVLPYDMGDLEELGNDGRYIEFRGGLIWSGERLRTSAGYQYRRFDDMPDRIINEATFSRNEIQGVLFDLGFFF